MRPHEAHAVTVPDAMVRLRRTASNLRRACKADVSTLADLHPNFIEFIDLAVRQVDVVKAAAEELKRTNPSTAGHCDWLVITIANVTADLLVYRSYPL